MPINVAIELRSLWCHVIFHEGSQEQASYGERHPYLFLIYYKFDGSTVKVAPHNFTALEGSPVFHVAPGCHGNLGSGIEVGTSKSIPADVGLWETTLEPILVNGKEVPGVIGFLGCVLEHNLTAQPDAEAGKRAFVEFVTEQMERVLPLNVLTLQNEITTLEEEAKESNAPITSTEAAEKVLVKVFEPAEKEIEKWTEDVLVATIIKAADLIEGIGDAIEADEAYSPLNETFSETALAKTGFEIIGESTGIPFELPTSAGEFGMVVSGFAWQQIRSIAVAEGVPGGRWQITNVNMSFSNDLREPYVSEVGGSLADGSPWWLKRDRAVKLIEEGVNSFFVIGDDGSEADVIVSDKNNVGHNYLTTVADASTEDNLTSLPPIGPYLESTVGQTP